MGRKDHPEGLSPRPISFHSLSPEEQVFLTTYFSQILINIICISISTHYHIFCMMQMDNWKSDLPYGNLILGLNPLQLIEQKKIFKQFIKKKPKHCSSKYSFI